MISYFVTFRHRADAGARVNAAVATCFAEIVQATPQLQKALLYTPADAHDPYLKDQSVPLFAAQLYFADIAALEAALAAEGHLQALTSRRDFPALLDGDVTQQAMVTRSFAVPNPRFRTEPGELPCTYLVAYEGTAENVPLWLSHYIAQHEPIMRRFPGIRELEIYTRLDWCGSLPWRRVDYMQRNKVVFDDAAALTAALNSPVRHEMRADFAKFPPFSGKNSHYPMATRTVMA
jgi:uncharacterized protein (TIGR02118 family)